MNKKVLQNCFTESLYTDVARVVDETREVAALGSIDNRIEVDTEQVRRSDSGRLVVRLPHIRHDRSDHLTHVLDHHLVRCYRLLKSIFIKI